MYKNQLQELAQRSCFNLPSYACIREGPDHAPRFKATVNFNGEVFESPTFCNTLRQAEHAAAEVALNVLSKNGPSKALAAKVLDETGVYKNLLQETAHRAGLKLPVYTTVRSGPGHIPVFFCTVDIAKMSFTGEPAKTKKQAQKNAAMAAWSALKRLSLASSSTSSAPLESGGNDELEQVTVARYLASLQPPEANKSAQRDGLLGQGSTPCRRDLMPNDNAISLYSMHCRDWSHSAPLIQLAHQSWPKERASQQQNHLLALPSAPTTLPRPQMSPIIRSIFQPDHGPCFLPREQEPAPLSPGIGPFLYFSNGSMPVPVSNLSQVTIQEIEEKPKVEQEWLNVDANSGCWKINFPSNLSGLSLVEIPKCPISPNSHSEPIQEALQGKEEENSAGNSAQLGTNQIQPLAWTSPRFADTRSSAGASDEANLWLQNQQFLDYLQSNIRSQNAPMATYPGSSRVYTRPSAAPVTIRSSDASSIRKPRPMSSSLFVSAPPPTRYAAPTWSTRPTLEGAKYTGVRPCSRFMAPAVNIRSVVPVCSAPPAKDRAGGSQEERAGRLQVQKLGR